LRRCTEILRGGISGRQRRRTHRCPGNQPSQVGAPGRGAVERCQVCLCVGRTLRSFFLGVRDLIETPSRIATLRMRSGDRSIAFAICSSVLDARASSITRRSSLKDQDFRTIDGRIPAVKETKPPAGLDRRTALPLWARTLGEIVRCSMSSASVRVDNETRLLSLIGALQVDSEPP
jgi:hypothetical protein